MSSFLEADGGRACRRSKVLRLEFFETHDACVVDRLIAAAVGAWGVEVLEVVVRLRATSACPKDALPAYTLRLEDGHRSRVRSLTLGNCTVAPLLQRYDELTTLVLRDMAASTLVHVYEDVFTQCARLQVLRLTSCGCLEDRMVVDAPCSEIRELVVDACSFLVLELCNLPMLARLACLTNTVELVFGSVPCLTHTNLTFFVEQDFLALPPPHTELEQFLGTSPSTMENLVLRFTGPRTWIGTERLNEPLLHLKRILVADLPLNWHASSWPRLLLVAAPSLEVLHIQVAHSEMEPEAHGIIWSRQDQMQCHPNMKELVMAGFKDGHVRYNGLWDWDMHQVCRSWSDKDKRVVKRTIKSGPRPLVELILG